VVFLLQFFLGMQKLDDQHRFEYAQPRLFFFIAKNYIIILVKMQTPLSFKIKNPSFFFYFLFSFYEKDNSPLQSYDDSTIFLNSHRHVLQKIVRNDIFPVGNNNAGVCIQAHPLISLALGMRK